MDSVTAANCHWLKAILEFQDSYSCVYQLPSLPQMPHAATEHENKTEKQIHPYVSSPEMTIFSREVVTCS